MVGKIIISITGYLKPQSQHKAMFLQNDIVAGAATLFSYTLRKWGKRNVVFTIVLSSRLAACSAHGYLNAL